MPRRLLTFTDTNIDPRVFTEDDKPTSSLHQAIGQIFREHRELLTKKEWAVVERRYCMDKSIRATAQELRISREKCRKLLRRAFDKMVREARRVAKAKAKATAAPTAIGEATS